MPTRTSTSSSRWATITLRMEAHPGISASIRQASIQAESRCSMGMRAARTRTESLKFVVALQTLTWETLTMRRYAFLWMGRITSRAWPCILMTCRRGATSCLTRTSTPERPRWMYSKRFRTTPTILSAHSSRPTVRATTPTRMASTQTRLPARKNLCRPSIS